MRKLAFGEVLSESFGTFFANLRLFFHLVTVPWVLSLALRVLDATFARDIPAGALVEKALDAIPTTMFMVAWMRFVLLGPGAIGRLPGLGWSRRESDFLIHLIKVAGMTFVLIAGFLIIVGSVDPASLNADQIDPELARREAMAAPLGVGFIVSALLALRVSFGLAASAVDLPFSPRHSWAYSRGAGLTVIGILFVIYLGGALAITMAALIPYAVMRGIFGADLGAAVIAWAAAILVSYASVGVAATAQAVIFRRLTGWRPGGPLAPS